MLNSKFFDSKITTQSVSGKEKFLGYILGPLGAMVLNGVLNTYLNIYYTDVLDLSWAWRGTFLVLFPLVSKVICAFASLFFGFVIENTKSKQGKARPWLLISAPLLTLSGILLFLVPKSNPTVQIIWVMISYNLYYSVAHAIYQVSHSLMVPLATRNAKQRGALSVVSNIGVNIVSGTVTAVVFALFVYPLLQKDTSLWLPVMSVISILALPLIIVEFYNTKERVTLEYQETKTIESREAPNRVKLKAMVTNKYWLLLIAFYFFFNISSSIRMMSTLYFSNWVIGTYETGGSVMTILNMVGGFPLGIGVAFIWPLCKKFGKRNVTLVGFVLGIVGSIVCYINPYSMPIVITGLLIKNIGLIPSAYIFSSMMGDMLDHVEWKSKLRCDGLSGSTFVFITTICSGIGVGLFNLVLSLTGYVAPDPNLPEQIGQSVAVQKGITFCYIGLDIVCFAIVVVVLAFFNIEKQLPTIHSELENRRRIQAEERGEEYVSSEERIRIEREQHAQQHIEMQLNDLETKCLKKGWDFEVEKEKYYSKLDKKSKKKKQ